MVETRRSSASSSSNKRLSSSAPKGFLSAPSGDGGGDSSTEAAVPEEESSVPIDSPNLAANPTAVDPSKEAGDVGLSEKKAEGELAEFPSEAGVTNESMEFAAEEAGEVAG